MKLTSCSNRYDIFQDSNVEDGKSDKENVSFCSENERKDERQKWKSETQIKHLPQPPMADTRAQPPIMNTRAQTTTLYLHL